MFIRAVWIKLDVNKCCCRYYEDVEGVKLFEMVYRIKLVNKVWKIGYAKLWLECGGWLVNFGKVMIDWSIN